MNFKLDSPAMRVMSWLADMLFLQVYAWMGIFRGFVIFGIFPSIIAMFGVSRSMIRADGPIGMKDKFWEIYKQEFWKANRLGVFVSVIAVLLVIYFRMTTQLTSSFATLFVFLGYALIILFAILSLYLPTLFVHLDLSIPHLFRHATIIMMASPVHSILMGLMLLLFLWIAVRFTILIPLVALSMLAYGLMYLSLHTINRLTERQGKMANR